MQSWIFEEWDDDENCFVATAVGSFDRQLSALAGWTRRDGDELEFALQGGPDGRPTLELRRGDLTIARIRQIENR